jgi:hypothetical protein
MLEQRMTLSSQKKLLKITWLIVKQTSQMIFPLEAITVFGLNCERGKRNLNLPVQSTESKNSLCYEVGWSRFESGTFRMRSVKH